MSYFSKTIIEFTFRDASGRRPDGPRRAIALGSGAVCEAIDAALAPLPRDREFMPEDAIRAKIQHDARRKLADHHARIIATEIASALADNDTVNGYCREEARVFEFRNTEPK